VLLRLFVFVFAMQCKSAGNVDGGRRLHRHIINT
jgi:hypothetical protein